MVHLVLLGKR